MKISAEEGELLEDVTVYRRIVGSVIYMIITRLDLELCNWTSELVYAGTEEATFGCG